MSATLGTTIGAELLSRLGFLHVPGPPYASGRAYLFIALRRKPTLLHFDPERVDYWVCSDGRGARQSVDWLTRVPAASEFSWGLIRIVDRLGVSNEYLSFGGELSVERIDDIRVIVYSSDAPIFARGGHSQGWDPGADQLAAFFARLRALAGRSLKTERHISSISPTGMYAAYVCATLAREPTSDQLLALPARLPQILRSEAQRLRAGARADWKAGEGLAGMLAASS